MKTPITPGSDFVLLTAFLHLANAIRGCAPTRSDRPCACNTAESYISLLRFFENLHATGHKSDNSAAKSGRIRGFASNTITNTDPEALGETLHPHYCGVVVWPSRKFGSQADKQMNTLLPLVRVRRARFRCCRLRSTLLLVEIQNYFLSAADADNDEQQRRLAHYLWLPTVFIHHHAVESSTRTFDRLHDPPSPLVNYLWSVLLEATR